MLFSRLSIAPMIDWTYPQFRYFMRVLAPNALLYTEMQTIGALQHNPARALEYHPYEHPIALQLGGADPVALGECAELAEKAGFDEINLNLGCPSDRVQSGRFGACMMQETDLVVDCIQTIKEKVNLPVSAKTRIGIDNLDSYTFFADFAGRLIEAGVDKLIVHARKAWLKGLSPKQNRTIPPINYDFVYRFKQEYPEIPMVINGNILSLEEVHSHLQQVDGVMLGRLVCQNPYKLAQIHKALYPQSPMLTRRELVVAIMPYLQEQADKGISLSLLLKGLLNLAHGLANSKRWKDVLTYIIKNKQTAHLAELIYIIEELESYNHGISA